MYPADPAERDRWVLARRGPRPALDRRRPGGWMVEAERTSGGELAQVLTVFLTNRECPWRCVFCDLWRHTLAESVQPGDIPAQIDLALGDPSVSADRCQAIKLYNAGSFFDAGAIPPTDDPVIAEKLTGFSSVIVESHPALVGDRCLRFRDLLAGRSEGRGRSLEVAMGLETIDPQALGRLNKRVTVERFATAAGILRREGIGLRAFVLVQPPFQDPAQAVPWAVRSVDFAFDCGATAVSLIPVRGGNGALEALGELGEFTPPNLSTFEEAVDGALAVGRGRVFADLWDLERLATCPRCYRQRRERLEQMNLSQSWIPAVRCECR